MLVALVFYFIKKPYEVETITIPLTMPTTFDSSMEEKQVEKINKTVAQNTPIKTTKNIEKKIIKVVEKTSIAKIAKESQQTKDLPKPLEQALAKAAAQENNSTSVNAMQTSPSSQLASDTAFATADKTLYKPVNPDIKANFDIIRKRTYAKLYYPQSAQNDKKVGTATLIYRLSQSGIIENIALEHSTGYKELDDIVLEAAKSLVGEHLKAIEKEINIRLSVEFNLPDKAI